MCQLDSGSAYLWKKWREIVRTLNVGPIRTESDPDVWEKSNVVSVRNGAANDVRSMGAKPRRLVPIFGFQTSLYVENAKDRTDAERVEIKENETGSVSSSSSETDVFEKTRLGYTLSDRLCVLYTRSKFLPRRNTEYKTRLQSEEMADAGFKKDIRNTMEFDADDILETHTKDQRKCVLRKTRSLNDLLVGQCQVLDKCITKASLKEKVRI